MEKSIDIYDAISNLPDELITDEIWMAGIQEGNLQILNVLPEKFMVEENINTIIENEENRYSWRGFKLSNIPEAARTQKICELAVKKDKDNIRCVPDALKNRNMLRNFFISASNHIHFLPLFPEHCWDQKDLYDGISSIYKANTSGGRKDNWDELRMIQILLHYAPSGLKTPEFYLGLFQTSMKVVDINFLTPLKFQTHCYYLEIAKKEVKALPIEKLDYVLLTQAMLSDKNCEDDFWGDWRNKNSDIKNRMFELLDDKMVDIILKRWPDRISELPDRYQTKTRLLNALASRKDNDRAYNIYSSFDIKQFDSDVCKVIVALQEYNCPKFASEIWTQDFIEFCKINAPAYYWFQCMPEELQTQEIVNSVIKRNIYKIQHVRPDLITYDIAVEAYLEKDDWNDKRKLEEYVPVHFLNDFVMETGLPKEFFGGETTYSDLKEKHKKYTYFTVGESYIGYYESKDSGDTYNRVIMTRRTPMQIKPSIVFNRTVNTFHKTWLEKIVSDNDPQFAKPTVEKGMKGKQINLYMGVRLVETFMDTKIYSHSFLGETILYQASYFEYSSLAALKEAIEMEAKKVKEKEMSNETEDIQVEIAC